MLRAGLWHRGKTIIVDVPTPDIGSDWSVKVPDQPEGIWWRIKSMTLAFSTSAVVGNRFSRFFYAPFTAPLAGDKLSAAYVITEPNAQTPAGTTSFLSCAEGGQLGAFGSKYFILPHDLRVPPGHVFSVITSNLDVGDQYKAIKLCVEEWMYEPPGEQSPNAGDGSGRVDVVKLNETMCRVEKLLQRAIEASVATP